MTACGMSWSRRRTDASRATVDLPTPAGPVMKSTGTRILAIVLQERRAPAARASPRPAVNCAEGTSRSWCSRPSLWTATDAVCGTLANRAAGFIVSPSSYTPGARSTQMIADFNIRNEALAESPVQQLKARLAGELILPSDESYDEQRSVFIGNADKRPALIVRAGD